MIKINNKKALLSSLIFEIRYLNGYVYLDRCGSILNELINKETSWVLSGQNPNPQGAPLVNLENNLKFNFSSHKLDLSLEQIENHLAIKEEKIELFAKAAKELTSIIMVNLNLKDEDVVRMGFRFNLLFGADTEADAERWLQDLKIFKIYNSFLKALSGELNKTSVALNITSDDRRYRISFNVGEHNLLFKISDNVFSFSNKDLDFKKREDVLKKLKKMQIMSENPRYASIIDVDSYQENPQVVKPEDFIKSSFHKIKKLLQDNWHFKEESKK